LHYDPVVSAAGPEPRRKLSEEEIDRLAHASRRLFASVPEVVALYLYGSAARGEAARDLDLGVVLAGPVPPATVEAWAATLQAEGAPAGPEIDLRVLSGAAPRFRCEVLRTGRLLYEGDERGCIEFEAAAMSEWLDFRPTWLALRRRMLERWIHG
jgi:predicted nucleotidyltransferase